MNHDQDSLSAMSGGALITREAQAIQPIYHDAEREVTHVARRQTGLTLARLFPSAIDKAMQSHQLDQFQTNCDYRRKALKMLVDAKLQAVEEFLNEALVKGKGHLRRERHDYITAERLRLQRALDRYVDEFNTMLEARLDRIASLRQPRLQELESGRLERDAERFHQWVDARIDEFEAIVSEGVQR